MISTGHGEGFQAVIASGQRGVGVIAALVIVVLDVEAAQLRVLDAEGAARVVDVLTVQRLQRTGKVPKLPSIHTSTTKTFSFHYQFGRLGSDNIWILDQGLECICKKDNSPINFLERKKKVSMAKIRRKFSLNHVCNLTIQGPAGGFL